MKYFGRIRLGLFLLLAGAAGSLWAGETAAKDELTIDQRNFELVGLAPDKTATKSEAALIRLSVKYALVSQPKGFLRAAVNVASETSFKTVLATEIVAGTANPMVEIEIKRPFPQVIRVIVWIDKDSATATPHPLASDNIAFESRIFRNSNDR